MPQNFTHSFFFIWIIVPLLIFTARILDVSLQTIRIIAISRNIRWLAPLVGFFEVLIWLIAIGQIMKNVSHPVAYIAYAGGFASGTWIGMIITERLSLGTVIVRIIAADGTEALKQELREKKFGFTSIPGNGVGGPVEILFTVVQRQKLEFILERIQTFIPNAFYTVEEVCRARQGLYPLPLKDIVDQGLASGLNINRK